MMARYLTIFCLLALLAGCTSAEQSAIKKASALISNDQLQEASIFLKDSLQQYPKNLDLLYLTGWVLMSQGQDDAALGYFGKCLHLDPNFYGSHNGLGALYLKQNKLQPAEKEFNLALKAKPDLPEIYGNLAEVKGKLGQYQEAKALLDKALTLKPAAADYPYLQARNAARANQLDEALNYLQQVQGKSFVKKSFQIQSDCLKGVVLSRIVEKSLQSSPEKSLSKEQKNKLMAARDNLLRCEKADPKRFVEFEARGRIASLLIEAKR